MSYCSLFLYPAEMDDTHSLEQIKGEVYNTTHINFIINFMTCMQKCSKIKRRLQVSSTRHIAVDS